jgi:hypothetical protein
MYTFAIVALLALATVKLVDVLCDYISPLRPLRSLLTFVAAIGAVWALDFSMFAEWGTAIRDSDVGMLITGFVVAGVTVAWRALFGFLTHDRARLDETLGEQRPELHRAA